MTRQAEGVHEGLRSTRDIIGSAISSDGVKVEGSCSKSDVLDGGKDGL